jgi:hypothetical protein
VKMINQPCDEKRVGTACDILIGANAVIERGIECRLRPHSGTDLMQTAWTVTPDTA